MGMMWHGCGNNMDPGPGGKNAEYIPKLQQWKLQMLKN